MSFTILPTHELIGLGVIGDLFLLGIKRKLSAGPGCDVRQMAQRRGVMSDFDIRIGEFSRPQ